MAKGGKMVKLTVKQSVDKAKEKELRSSDVKVLENLAKEVSVAQRGM